MKAFALGFLSLFLLSACTFLDPYNITFTTPDKATVNPQTDTLDLALNQEALAYISRVQCDANPPLEILPTVNDETNVSAAHNLSLKALDSQAQGSLCRVTVTAFNRTTTANAQADIHLYVLSEEAAPELSEESTDEPTEEPKEESVPETEVPDTETPDELTPNEDTSLLDAPATE